ncbi:SMP-30/Gluconolaconase/LRE-like region-containing protein [Bradyrhizobium sp. Rc2d]|uniref:SMP-30/gluconolactonase/LRE family protein n=1 Tax=Bradyrhizobium sp. Rc2d TaxID=1855321 RepID=UPI00088DCA55|nr:SMP-30/gluconolactonase/LRE family protein [Bradyrhizobium sp. Rc2d]SDJ74541.1 SMP-30/Gluconolaconase/LRE-like region-containing protein [Bradyrhizobium sp. Rc2d]
MSLARDIFDRVFFPDRDVHAIPVLDGGFSPNEKLDSARQIGAAMEAPDAMTLDDGGTLFVSSGTTVFACTGADFESRRPLIQFDANAGALAWSERTGLLVAVSGRGVCAVNASGKPTGWVTTVEDTPLHCPTAIAIADDGSIFITEGSRHNPSDRWLADLMQKRAPSGRLIACDAGLNKAQAIVGGLDWPAGVAIAHDGRGVLVTESWPHRLSAYDLTGQNRRVLVKNFTGYPARIVRGENGDYWIAFFALRTQLTEFVLREHAFRTRMMANVPPHLWVGPTLGGTFDYREPTQIGRIKKLGIQKPWAPPRSYGLVARLDADGNAIESFHSRSSGKLHGLTSVIVDRGRVLVASKGHGKIAELAMNPTAGRLT